MNDVSANLLDAPVSDLDIATIAANYLTKWEDLSPFLDLTPQHETNIKNTYGDYSVQKRQILLKWREIKGNAASYRALITAATTASNMELVDNVKAMLRARLQQPAQNGAPAPVPRPPERQARMLSELIIFMHVATSPSVSLPQL